MAQLFDFRCLDCNLVFEGWDTSDRDAKPACPGCGHEETRRLIAAPRLDYIGMATSGKASSDGSATAIDKWDKMRRQKMKTEQRNQERHGTYR